VDSDRDVASTIYFSAPWLPHIQNPLTAVKVVGRVLRLVSLPQGILVLTTTEPYLITGDMPERFNVHRLESRYPALSKHGVCVYRGACIWTSNDGLAMFGGEGIQLLSSSVIDVEYWRQLEPVSMRLGEYRGVIYCNGSKGTLCYRYAYSDFYMRTMGVVSAFYQDDERDELLYTAGGIVFSVGTSRRRLSYRWVGKPRITAGVPYSSARVVHDGDGVELQVYAGERDVLLDTVPDSRHVVKSQHPFRIKSTARYRDVCVGVRGGGSTRVRSFLVANDMREIY
ncbi:MAG: hypothetical protein ACK4RS_01930, partial [Thiothrix sp.]